MSKLRTPAMFSSALLVVALAACGGGGGGSAASFCEAGKDWEQRFENLDPTTGGFDEVQEALADLAGDVPDEIQDEFDVVRDAVDALADVDFSDTDAVLEALENFDQEELEAASNTIEQWINDNCE